MARPRLTPRSDLWRVSVTTSAEAEDAIAVLMETIFTQPPSIYTDAESGESVVTVYLAQRLTERLQYALRVGVQEVSRCGLSIGKGTITTQPVRREDWRESWKKHFPPLVIGTRLLVKPSWSRRKPLAGQAVVILDPGLSFGTGQHPTTSFCLRQVAAFRQPGESQCFLDVGTGSGILAIAAAKLGYQPVRAVEIDPEAVRVARANCHRNRLDQRITILQRNLAHAGIAGRQRFDLICANLTDDLLLSEAPRLVGWLKPGGRLVLAGILTPRFLEVVRKYESLGLRLTASRVEKEWQSGAFERMLQSTPKLQDKRNNF